MNNKPVKIQSVPNSNHQPAVDDIARVYVGAILHTPEAAPEICQRAYDHFIGLAEKATDVQLAGRLEELAQEFATHRVALASRPATVSDFHDMLQERAAAYEQVGSPDSDTDIDVEARQAEIHSERTPGAARVVITPPSINQNTPLGRIATIKFDPTPEETRIGIKSSDQVARWQGDKIEAQAFTVDVGVIKIADALANTTSQRAFGTIHYGSDGTRVTARFDIGAGVRLTAVGSYCEIEVGMDPPRTDYTSAIISIGASIGMFAAPSLAPVTFTSFFDSVIPAIPLTIPRPERAVLLLPIQSSVIGGTALIEFLDLGMGAPLYSYSFLNSAVMQPIPLSDDVAYIRLTNTGMGASNYRLVFQLSL